jgi:hypothetical protein
MVGALEWSSSCSGGRYCVPCGPSGRPRRDRLVGDDGQRSDWFGGGVAREYDSAAATVTISGTAADLTVHTSGGPSSGAFTLEFAGPPGADLQPGMYFDAERAAFRSGGLIPRQ